MLLIPDITGVSIPEYLEEYMISPPMQVLELDNCSLLTSVSLDLPRLQNIRLVYCRKYVSTSFSFSPEKY